MIYFSDLYCITTCACVSLKVCKAPLPRDVESLQQLIVAHKDFEGQVQGHEPEIDQVKNLFNAIPQKTPKEQAKLDKVHFDSFN